MESKGKNARQCSLFEFNSALKSPHETHIRTHHKKEPFFCDQCEVGFSSKSGLNNHVLTVHQGQKIVCPKKYKCSLCQYTSSLSYGLQQHITRKHKSERTFICEFPNCDYRGKTSAHLRQHSVRHSEQRPFACDFQECSYQAKRKINLEEHKLTMHNDGQKPFNCSVCNYCASTRSALIKHQATHKEENSVKCNFSGCAFSCKSNSALSLHVRNRHAEKTFDCDFDGCQVTAGDLNSLKQHKKYVHSEKTNKCPFCDYRATYPSTLKKHITMCHSKANQRIPCPTKGCYFRARHRIAFNQHIRQHKANLGCPVNGCSYVGLTGSSLKRHVLLHGPTGRPVACPLCPKYFPTNSRLSLHLYTHTREKPFTCPSCTFRSGHSTGITHHVRKIHSSVLPKPDEELTYCDHCNRNFDSSLHLAMHRVELKTTVVVLTRLRLKFEN